MEPNDHAWLGLCAPSSVPQLSPGRLTLADYIFRLLTLQDAGQVWPMEDTGRDDITTPKPLNEGGKFLHSQEPSLPHDLFIGPDTFFWGYSGSQKVNQLGLTLTALALAFPLRCAETCAAGQKDDYLAGTPREGTARSSKASPIPSARKVQPSRRGRAALARARQSGPPRGSAADLRHRACSGPPQSNRGAKVESWTRTEPRQRAHDCAEDKPWTPWSRAGAQGAGASLSGRSLRSHRKRGQQTISSKENKRLKLETNFFLNCSLLWFCTHYFPSMHQTLHF
ncbi:uncharacterized protein LOC120613200 [Pteropus medius]|uniref:uncharacterized protein LOC120613200 n=1 Tax=Pteropus vampyrus TaxID=132908 RepID=UPI00196A7FEE|nr:uncharacterized protein LOC120613200 [Pteropus giganteus]